MSAVTEGYRRIGWIHRVVRHPLRLEQPGKTGICSQRNDLERDQTCLHQRKSVKDPLRLFHIRTLEHENRLITVAAKIQFTEYARLMQFPCPRCLGLKKGFELIVGDPRCFFFECQQFHDIAATSDEERFYRNKLLIKIGIRKYAQHIPAKTNPARATKDQSAILISPSFILAFLTAKYIASPATARARVESTPKTMSRILSGIGSSVRIPGRPVRSRCQ